MQPRSSPSDAARRAAVWCATPTGLAVLFAAGLLIRLVLARGGGFPFDISSFAGWADRLADRGPWNFYPAPADDFFVDYPPGYLYGLWVLGTLTQAFTDAAPSTFVLKLPPILADLGLAWLVMTMAARITPERVTRRFPVHGIAAAAVLLNPAIFFVSAVWGQVDSVAAVLVLGALIFLGTGDQTFRREAAGVALLAVAVGTKPQAAFVLPLVALVLVWRHVRSRTEGAAGRELVAAAAAGAGRVSALVVVGAVAGQLLLAPFRLGPLAAFDFYSQAAGTYPVTSVFAFNGWGIVGFWRPDVGDEAVRFLGLPALVWALALFVVGAALVLWRAWLSLRRGEDEGRVLVAGSVAIALVGFAFLTRVHERYLFLPLALLAVLVGMRWLRRAFVALSVLYLVNVFFPYVYYLDFVGRPAPTLGGLVDVFYGDLGSAQLRLLSAVTTAACVVIAWRAWPALERAVEEEDEPDEHPGLPAAVQPPAGAWSLHLHPIGARGVLLAFALFVVALGTRLPGLGHPPGMYFDEVYHARTGAEYLEGKDVFEWTHPPLAKEMIAVSIATLSGFDARPGSGLPSGIRPRTLASGPDGFVWTEQRDDRALVQSGVVDGGCSLTPTDTWTFVVLTPEVVAVGEDTFFLAGAGTEGSAVVRVDGRTQQWTVLLPSPPADAVALGDRVFVLTADGSLVYVSPEGEPTTVAEGVGAISVDTEAEAGGDPDDGVAGEAPPSGRGGLVWASFPQDGRIESWDADGRRASTIAIPGAPLAIASPSDTERVLVSTGNEVVVVDTRTNDASERIAGPARFLTSVRDAQLVWAVEGRRARVIEPRSAAVIGNTTLASQPAAVVADPVHNRAVAVTSDRIECMSGRPQVAWRFGSAVMGAAMVGLVALLALRLFGSLWAAGLAGLFMAVDGLAFTMSRIALPETYTGAFLLAAWFCALSALYKWGGGDADPSRRATIGWLAASGVFVGLASASKWLGVYALMGIGLLFLWDAFARQRKSIWTIAGSATPSTALFAVCLGVIPLLVYVATYIPFFSLGNSLGDLIRLQSQMYGYHSGLEATHPFSSPWWGWPFGHRAVFLYLAGSGAERAEIWTVPNIVVLWGGLVAMGVMAVRSARLRNLALGVVVLAALAQYVPWIAVGRVIFLYHYLPVVPFLAIALGWGLVVGLRNWRFRIPFAAVVVAAAIAFLVVLLPILVGSTVSVGYLDGIRRALPWVIR